MGWREQFVTQYSDMLGKTMERCGSAMIARSCASLVDVGCGVLHEQECCESVEIIDVIGELDDLVGAPIYMAEEVVSQEENPDGVEGLILGIDESYTWTFYKFATSRATSRSAGTASRTVITASGWMCASTRGR